jgi:hypothetical protein
MTYKVRPDIRTLADKYFCEQCDRLGLPRPPELKPRKKAREGERETMGEPPGFVDVLAPKMGLEAIWKAFNDD